MQKRWSIWYILEVHLLSRLTIQSVKSSLTPQLHIDFFESFEIDSSLIIVAELYTKVVSQS